MDILEAKKLVIEAGEKLVETGLIARTWGNVSCRVDDKTFVITPSGKPYIGLKPDDIVEVAIEDCAWSGDVKPSSEKGIHAEVYKIYPEANFVIHTHQTVASCISVLKSGIDTVTGEAQKIIGNNVILAAYGLSGTKKLKKGVSAALRLSPSKAVIMSHHGALCYGSSYDEAFSVAAMLEKISAEYILNAAKNKFNIIADDLDAFCEGIVSKVVKSNKTIAIDKSQLYNSCCDRENGRITLTNCESGEETVMDLESGNVNGVVSDTAQAHRSIYLAQPKLNYIIHNSDKATVAASVIGKKMKPLIDDFGQICGTSVKVAKTPDKCGKKIRGKNAVLLKDRGALCCGGVQGDAEAVDMIMTKSSLALLTTKVLDAAKPVNPVAALLERVVYTMKYSKQATK